MTTNEDRIRECLALADELEADLPPQLDPHMWEPPRALAVFLRDLARRIAMAA